jgi:hypothetical protein
MQRSGCFTQFLAELSMDETTFDAVSGSPLTGLINAQLAQMPSPLEQHARNMIEFFRERPEEIAQSLNRYLALVDARQTALLQKCDSTVNDCQQQGDAALQHLEALTAVQTSCRHEAESASFLLEAAIRMESCAREKKLIDEDWVLRVTQEERRLRAEDINVKKHVLFETVQNEVERFQRSHSAQNSNDSFTYWYSDAFLLSSFAIINAERFSAWAFTLDPTLAALQLTTGASLQINDALKLPEFNASAAVALPP